MVEQDDFKDATIIRVYHTSSSVYSVPKRKPGTRCDAPVCVFRDFDTKPSRNAVP